MSSPIWEEELRQPSPKKCPANEGSVGSKRPRVSEGGSREFSAMDHSFEASGFIAAMLRAATILKSVEPRLIVVDE
ncbi:hypothetical protein PIB30_096986, partial [Stylosanthes scabra]|nr:hypothetical protein [Stylosanthes scabra]